MKAQSYVYKTINHCDLSLDLFHPGDGFRPVLLWLHGGGLIFGGRHEINQQQLELYLQYGFAVVSLDYRLAPEVKLPDILLDLQDGHHYLQREAHFLKLRFDRLVVAGHSAGGYLALMSGILFKPVPIAVVSLYGYGDIAAEWYAKPDFYYLSQPIVTEEEAFQNIGKKVLSNGIDQAYRWEFYVYCRQQGIWINHVAGLMPGVDNEALHKLCPLRLATTNYPPTFLAHGDQDSDVPFAQSQQMADRLSGLGVQCQLMTIFQGEHAFDQDMQLSQVKEMFMNLFRFLDELNVLLKME